MACIALRTLPSVIRSAWFNYNLKGYHALSISEMMLSDVSDIVAQISRSGIHRTHG